MNQTPPKFPYGHVAMTIGAAELGESVPLLPYLRRHIHGDWGDVSKDDAEENELSIREGFRIWSVYNLPENPTSDRLYIITEADRSATTFLLPSEY